MSRRTAAAAHSEPIELRRLGCGTQGSAPVLGRTLSFERSVSRLSLLGELARTARSALQWRWGDVDTVRADCRSRRGTHAAGVVEIVGQPMEIEWS